MPKLIAAINMTLDGYCDHTSMIADDELHDHYTALLSTAGSLLYGRVVYQLMESFWPDVVKNPTGNRATDDFARVIDKVPKIIFSRSLKHLDWESARLAKGSPEEEVSALKRQGGKDIFVGSPSLIVALTKLNLIDEYQLCVHPVIAGKGLPLFRNMEEQMVLKLLRTKTLGGGQVVFYYQPK